MLMRTGGWWRRRRRYRAEMRPAHFKPEPRPSNLDGLEGKWVAVENGRVIQAAETSHELAVQLHAMDHRRRRRVVVEFVRPDSDSFIVGVG